MLLLVVPVLITLLIITALVLLMPLAVLVFVLVFVLFVIAVFTIPLLAGIPPLLLVPLALNVVSKQLLPLLFLWNLEWSNRNISHASYALQVSNTYTGLQHPVALACSV